MRLMLGLLTLAMIVPTYALADGQGQGPPTRFVVGFYDLPSDRGRFAGENVISVNDVVDFFVVATGSPTAFRAQAQRDPNVRYVEEDLEAVHASLVPNDQLYNQYQYDMKPATTNMENAWDRSTGTTAVKLCILDTGQHRVHADLNGLTYFYWKDEINGNANPYDDNGHGTHVTGTAAAEMGSGQGVAGIAPGASIGGIKLLNRQGSGTFTQVANGITSGRTAGCHIESLSLGATSTSTALNDAVAAFIGGGGFMAAAAGNGGCSNCIEYPARLPGVTAVTCSDQNNRLCSFSSTGPEADLIAPGQDIASTWTNKSPCRRNDNNCYVLSSGTSMSTPHVAGLAALYKSTHSSANGAAIESALKAGARDLGLPASQQGAGLIQGTVV